MLLSYLITQEMKRQGEKEKTEFELSVFANDPKRYYEMFAQPVDEEQIEWLRPESPEDIMEIMKALEDLPG